MRWHWLRGSNDLWYVVLHECSPICGLTKLRLLTSRRHRLHEAERLLLPVPTRRGPTTALDDCPQRVYFIAARFGWDELMEEAAWRTVYDLSDHYDPAMDSVPASVYRRLLVYRQTCRKVISSRCVLDFDVPEEERHR